MNKKLKIVAGLSILLITIVAFVRYTTAHPEVLQKLGTMSAATLVLLLGIYALGFVALVFIMRSSLRLYDKTIPFKESGLLNAYSSLVNFFGPGQSGAAVRAVYLQKHYDFKLKSYMFTTLLYYGFYAAISALLLVIGSRPWWQTGIILASVVLGSAIVIQWYIKKSRVVSPSFNVRNVTVLFLATALQVSALVAVYYIELRTIDPTVTLAQALSYTGAANFSLFVALTPGAIGIREAFLVFSQGLHHISNSTIVTANIIDRGVYLVFLVLLSIVVLASHAHNKFRLSKRDA